MSSFKHIVFLLFLISHLLSFAQEGNGSFEEASQLYKKGNYAQAYEILNNIVNADKENFDAFELLANSAAKIDKSKDVLKLLDGMIEENPSLAEYFFFRGVLNLQLQKYNKSLDDLDKAIAYEIAPEYKIKVFLTKGMLHLQLQEYELAEEVLLDALSLDSKNANANHSLGMLKYENQQYDEAISYFLKALKLDKDNLLLNYNLGMTYMKIEDDENACFYFNKACDFGYKNACKMLYLECTP